MKIEKNIPIPDVYEIKETVSRMKSGDSVLFKSFKEARRFSNYMRYHKIPCVFRKLSVGARVWKK